MRVDLYQDIGGAYFPLISAPDKFYSPRADGRVEEVTVYEDHSAGVVVENRRGKIKKNYKGLRKDSTGKLASTLNHFHFKRYFIFS